ncbi:pyrroloquinoline-quinone synthase [Ktedonobacteria bacterium brp13]|nr:pyrroloquinoline-quinone synthase [Ktedonobacteria bacterium brp13]
MTTTVAAPLSREEFIATLQAQSERYYHKHPFNVSMNTGQLNRRQIQLWTANRFYYQRIIPLKDAAILSNCPDPAIRRVWIQRIIDHDGTVAGQGGIEDWLKLAEAVGLSRAEVLDERYIVSGVRFAADAYVTFAKTQPWIEAVAASLTEWFAPDLMKERIEAFKRHYSWVNTDGLTYLNKRLTQAPNDAGYAIEIVIQHCHTREQQERAIKALVFKCEVLWSMLDTIHHAVKDVKEQKGIFDNARS